MHKPKHFNENEFNDYSKMDQEFLEWLEDLREAYGKPIKINSSFRDPNHNERVGGVSRSAHTEIPCRAVDIHCAHSLPRWEIISLAIKMGCKRIGVGENFVHLDFSVKQPNPRIWTYYK